MSHNEIISAEEILEDSKEYHAVLISEKFLEDGYEIVDKKECEEFFDCVEEQSQEAKSFTYNVINKGAFSLKYSMSGMSYLAFAASYATYFASYVPYGISYATDFAANVSSCASSCLDKSEKGYEQNITDQAILSLKHGINFVTSTMSLTSSILSKASNTMCKISDNLYYASNVLYNGSSALNKENIDYACTTADEYVGSFSTKVSTTLSDLADSSTQISDKVGTMLNSISSSAQKVFPHIPMVV